MMEMFHVYTVQYSSCKLHEATEHFKLASATEELNFLFYIILINLNLTSHCGNKQRPTK